MSFAAALLGLAGDLNEHLGAQHDIGKLRQQDANKLVEHQRQRQHQHIQKQEQRKRFREEQQQQQQLLQVSQPATLQPISADIRTQRRGAWSSGETSQLQALLRSTRRRKRGYSTDSDEDDSDTERSSTADHGSSDLHFDDYCSIARRMRRPVQEVMTQSATANSPLTAFLRSSATHETAAPHGSAVYAAFIAQQFDLSLGLEADRRWSEERQQREELDERAEQKHTKRGSAQQRQEHEHDHNSAQENRDGERKGGEKEVDETESANGKDSASQSERRMQPVRNFILHEDEGSNSDESHRGEGLDSEYENEQEEHEEQLEEEDDSESSNAESGTDDEDSEDSGEDESLVETGSESDVPLSARVKKKAERSRPS